MYIRIDSSSGVPLWQQVVAQVTRLAVSGGFAPGERLPTVRELATELRINPNTVARAYQELERDGVVETRRGSGTFAAETPAGPHPALQERLGRIAPRVDALAVEAVQLQIGEDDLLRLVAERMRQIARTSSGGVHSVSGNDSDSGSGAGADFLSPSVEEVASSQTVDGVKP